METDDSHLPDLLFLNKWTWQQRTYMNQIRSEMFSE